MRFSLPTSLTLLLLVAGCTMQPPAGPRDRVPARDPDLARYDAPARAPARASHGTRDDDHDHAPQDPVARARRFLTSRRSDVDLPLPEEKDAFLFAVFGDRTGGPADGVKVLAEAVGEVNLIEPDLVMTVGDLVEGYNTREPWLAQMREFKGIMGRLSMPWFPVAGNHDVYWRGPGKPDGEHEGDYEAHFGPLWYAFRHKRCWFVALYSDESNPETGEKSFDKPECQRMSPEQLAWLEDTLGKAREAEHVFVFLHHPRWLPQYGDDWARVHALLARAGNVTAVFAGHIHRMRYDGVRDGIEYFTLATVGGVQNGDVPQAGYLHQYHLVTVRKDRIAVAAVPVGAVFDPRAVTGAVSDEARRLRRELTVAFGGPVALDAGWGAGAELEVRVKNPIARRIDVTLTPGSPDPRWLFRPDHAHAIVEPGGELAITLRVDRLAERLDSAFDLPELEVRADYLGDDLRIQVPALRFPIPLSTPHIDAPPPPPAESFLRFDGDDDCIAVADAAVRLPQGPLTLEAWIRADAFADRQGVVAKTELCEYGFFANGGVPEFSLHVDGRYATARDPDTRLDVGRWHHLAGVFDGAEVRLYVDGRRVARVAASGARTLRALPLMVGADVDAAGNGVSHFDGAIDEVRLSSTARYSGERFEPARRHAADADTVLLLHADGAVGPWLFDSSPRATHPRRGSVRIESDATGEQSDR